jgi:hypothetical protein
MDNGSLKEDTKRMVHAIMNKIQVYGFWCMIIFILGIWAGIAYTNKTKSNENANSIKLGGFIHNNKVYEIKERAIQ